ncbi:Protein_disulfide isomerase PDI5 [Hexamita inflata]|uniref:Thioredoxin n=1 Tax=Hexamita inflata TaxID=28002 RepID=A0AA86TN57_9EUKA|nr:Protein disulfide isomerase PDI5 [Hexamita inflata]CAI9923679.1 Protein disulfide isomerase PDI5 [Hexamita inflata]
MLFAIPTLMAVVDYTQTFNETIKNGKPTLVKFFAPWCGHCKALAPKFETLSELMAETQFVIAEVDCTIKMDICQQEGVRGYPTLRFYNNGEFVEQYKGQREAESLKQWLLEKVQ